MFGDNSARVGRACKGNQANVFVIDERRADFRAVTVDEIDDAFRNSRFLRTILLN
jgi:hypothetical protein